MLSSVQKQRMKSKKELSKKELGELFEANLSEADWQHFSDGNWREFLAESIRRRDGIEVEILEGKRSKKTVVSERRSPRPVRPSSLFKKEPTAAEKRKAAREELFKTLKTSARLAGKSEAEAEMEAEKYLRTQPAFTVK